MRVLVTGGGKSGAWQIRGEQLGAAIGASVVPDAALEEMEAADVVVLVKRPPAGLLERLHASRARVVWDIVDAWPQPAGNDWSRGECLDWLKRAVEMVRPAGIVAATRAMATDCGGFGVPVLALAHHPRRYPARGAARRLTAVGYEGSEDHLGSWRGWFEAECAARGVTFTCNARSLQDLDIVVALRERCGYAPMHWKSNVKLANAQASGTPVICGRESGYIETASGGEVWADTAGEVRAALDLLTAPMAREAVSEMLLTGRIEIEALAKDYLTWLASLSRS